jgi:hypothetical protein
LFNYHGIKKDLLSSRIMARRTSCDVRRPIATATAEKMHALDFELLRRNKLFNDEHAAEQPRAPLHRAKDNQADLAGFNLDKEKVERKPEQWREKPGADHQ